jgi:hypothetical protein
VVDGNVWTSSGVTAGECEGFKGSVGLRERLLGQDMAAAFIEHLAGKEQSDKIRGIIELSVKNADDDEFAQWHGLVGSDTKG